MYGDPSALLGLARRMRDVAGDVRAEADRLVGRAEATTWTGVAADAVRRRARERAGDLRRTAALHDAAAEALERHAREVERLRELIAAAERRLAGLLDAVRERADDWLDPLGGRLDDWTGGLADRLERITPPPPGHRDWLDLELPGLLPGLGSAA